MIMLTACPHGMLLCGGPSGPSRLASIEGQIVAEKETMARPRRISQLDIEAFDDNDEDLDGSHRSASNRPATSR
jgi:hypothetical protein